MEFLHPQSLQSGKGGGGLFCQVWDPEKNPGKKKKKPQDNHLEFKTFFIQEEAVEDGGELIHCPEENPEETKKTSKKR